MRYLGKEMGEIKLVCSGAGAAALACLNMLKPGVKQEKITVCDQHGVLRTGVKNRWISTKRTARKRIWLLKEALVGADAFLDYPYLVIDQDDIKNMADRLKHLCTGKSNTRDYARGWEDASRRAYCDRSVRLPEPSGNACASHFCLWCIGLRDSHHRRDEGSMC